MGNIIRAECNCGFNTEMFLGGGIDNFNSICIFPVFCKKCSYLYEANLLDKKLSCPKCRQSDVIPYDDKRLCKRKGKVIFSWNIPEGIDREYTLTEGKYLCPICGQSSMSFASIGHWD